MKIYLSEIKAIFDNLLEEKNSREEISNWAFQRMKENDADNLEFEPFHEKKKIWRGITYLMGVDLRDIDGEYLHSIENFIDFRRDNNL